MQHLCHDDLSDIRERGKDQGALCDSTRLACSKLRFVLLFPLLA